MTMPNLRAGIFAAMLANAACILPASAELPILNEQPWIGYFIGFENNRYQFGFTGQGKATITPIGDKDKPVSNKLAVSLEFVIEETKPDGSISVRKIQPATLESAQPATDKPGKISFRGKVSGDAGIEGFIEQSGGVFSVGGRLLDAGTLKNPLRFSVRVKVPSAYPNEKKDNKNNSKVFEKKIADDRIDLKWTDGKRKKLSSADEVEAVSKEINGPGLTSVQIEFNSYQGKKIEFITSENAVMTLWNDHKAPLHEGFSINWVPDPVKDPTAKARLSFEVR